MEKKSSAQKTVVSKTGCLDTFYQQQHNLMRIIGSDIHTRLQPLGLKNVGNSCYANAAMHCLLNTALSQALLDPTTAVIFRRYSSNPNLLAMGSGSVDSDEDEESFMCLHLDPLTPRHLSNTSSSLQDNKGFSITPSKEFRPKRDAKVIEKEKTIGRENCQWLTCELTSIARHYNVGQSVENIADNSNTMIEGILGNLFPTFVRHNVVDPGSITRHVNRLSPCLRPYQQEDAHEFLRALLSTLTMEGRNRQLSSLFDGLLESAVTCQTCRHASITRDRYMDISLDIYQDDVIDLVGALEKFIETEILDEDNKVYCSKCKIKRVVSKGLRLATAPTILVCHLKRFAFDMYGGTTRLGKYIKYPYQLEIGEFMSRVNRGNPPPYVLVGVLVHSGDRCDSGHYLAYVKSGNDWYKANDSIITNVDLKTVLSQNAYVLLYEVEGIREHHILYGYRKYHTKGHQILQKNINECNGKNILGSSTLSVSDEISIPINEVSLTPYISSKKSKDTLHSSIRNELESPFDKRVSILTVNEKSKISLISSFLDNISNLCNSSNDADNLRDSICIFRRNSKSFNDMQGFS